MIPHSSILYDNLLDWCSATSCNSCLSLVAAKATACLPVEWIYNRNHLFAPPATAPSAIFVDGLAQGSASPCRSAVHHWSSDAAKHNGSCRQLCGDIRHMCNCIHKWFHTATYFCTSCRLDLHHCFLFAVALQCVHARENDIKLTFFESNLCATSGRCRMLPNSISNLFDGW